jgi:hypothetical protein
MQGVDNERPIRIVPGKVESISIAVALDDIQSSVS